MEAPHPKMNPVQYLRCQNYSHARTYVHHTPKCVKCGDTHNSNKCLKNATTPAICALCGGAHPASYKGCLKYKLYQKARNRAKATKLTEIYTSNSRNAETKTSSTQEINFSLENNFPPLCQPQ